MPSERSQTQKDTQGVIPLTGNVQNRQGTCKVPTVPALEVGDTAALCRVFSFSAGWKMHTGKAGVRPVGSDAQPSRFAGSAVSAALAL